MMMKRTGPPVRTMPMGRGKPLTRGRPLARGRPMGRGGKPLTRRTPLAVRVRVHPVVACPRPARPRRARDTGPTRRVRRLVYARCGAEPGHPGRCEWPACPQQRTDLHHRLGRKAGGRFGEMADRLNGAAWLLGCCPRHHRMVTSRSGRLLAEAKASGWLLDEGQDGRLVPVMTRHHPDRVLLDDTGGWTPLSR